MAVTIQSVELMQPLGELDCTYFPDGDLDGKIGGWLTQAKAKVLANASIAVGDQNGATRAYSYYLAYSYLSARFASMPNSVSVNNGADSVSYGQDRVSYWSGKALAALADYQGLVSEFVKTTNRNSMPVAVRVLW